MLVHRVVAVDPSAAPGTRYHPGFVPRSLGASRIDNADLYDTLYVASSAACAVAEAFGSQAPWGDYLLRHPKGFTRRLATFELSDTQPILDLDDGSSLVRRGLRPSRVATRDREVTQAWARSAFREDRWQGIAWWSYYDPDWTTLGLWCPPGSNRIDGLRLVDLTPVSRAIDAVGEACEVLLRTWD